MTINQAIVALRLHREETQQEFAAALGMGISTIQNYESLRKNRQPAAAQLLRLERAAYEVKRKDLARLFHAAAERTLMGAFCSLLTGKTRETPRR